MSEGRGIIKNALKDFGPIPPFKPHAYYDEGGDCIEFIRSNDPFFARRLDNWVTVYHSEKTGEVTGGLIKSIAGLVKKYPAIGFQIKGRLVRVACVLRAPSYQVDAPVVYKKYESVIELAEEEGFVAELQEA